MRSRLYRVLLTAGLLLACDRGSAQEPGSRLDFTGGAPAVERRPPVETLERLSEGRLPRAGGEGAEEREPDEIETDRDSFTPATTIVGRRRLVVESAYSFIDNRGIKETHSAPELILRYGLTERVELRLGWNYEVGGTGNDVSGADAADEGDPLSGRSQLIREYTLSYGAKFRVTKQSRWLPASAVIVQAFTPTGGEATATQLVATYVAGWVFPNRWKFDAAVRYGTASEEGDHFNQWAPSVVLKVPVGEKWAGHVEYFGIFTTGKERNTTQHFVSPGLHYLVTPDLEIGFRLGWGLNDQSARFFSNVGVGWRF